MSPYADEKDDQHFRRYVMKEIASLNRYKEMAEKEADEKKREELNHIFDAMIILGRAMIEAREKAQDPILCNFIAIFAEQLFEGPDEWKRVNDIRELSEELVGALEVAFRGNRPLQ